MGRINSRLCSEQSCINIFLIVNKFEEEPSYFQLVENLRT